MDMRELLKIALLKKHFPEYVTEEENAALDGFANAVTAACAKIPKEAWREMDDGHALWEQLPPEEREKYADWRPREFLVLYPFIFGDS